MKKSLLFLFVLKGVFCFGQTIPEIHTLIQEELKTANIPALGVAVIKSGKIVHLSADGYSDLEQKIEAKTSTAFHIASVSKTVICLSIFKLLEQKKVQLDVDINNYLPFTVQNPHHKDDKITISELLNHRSGIIDNYKIYEPHWMVPKGDSDIKLQVFLQDYLCPGGKMDPSTHYAKGNDYKLFKYSNTGYALLGLIIEQVSSESLENFCQKNLFDPLSIKNTSWFLKNLDLTNVAKTYVYTDSTGHQFKGYNGYPDYPAGQLRASISDFAQLYKAYLNAKTNSDLLKYSSVMQITPNPVIGHGGFHTWYLTAHKSTMYYNHEGGDVGARTIILLDVRKGNAIIIFANTEATLGSLWRKIAETVFEG